MSDRERLGEPTPGRPGGDTIERILQRVTVPDIGLVLRASWDNPTSLLSRAERAELGHLIDGITCEPLCGSTDENGHWADIVQVSPRYWATRHVEEHADASECLVFTTFEDACAHYEQVIRGQQDATSGKAWSACDVPGVLAGEDLRLAERAGFSYEDAAHQYTADRDAALAAWSMLAALTD